MGEITIKDIARLAGVGVSTVSRAINNHPDINPETKLKIQKLIEQYGYIPNNSARNLKRQDSNTIGLLIKGGRNQFFLSLLPAFEDAVSKRGYYYISQSVSEYEDEIELALQLEKEKRLKGIVFLGASDMADEEDLRKIPVPSVFCTLGKFKQIKEEHYSSVAIDDYAASYKMTEHLIKLGHERIAYLGSRQDDKSIGRLRYRGYKDALKKNGIEFDKSIVSYMLPEYEPYSMENGYAMMKTILNGGFSFTAVFAVSDAMAIGAIRALLDENIKVPEMCSVAGFDGIDSAKYYNPRLTTIKQPGPEMIEKSAEILIDIIEGKIDYKHEIFDAEIISGESTIYIKNKNGI